MPLSELFHDLVTYEFWRRALIGGLLISVVCSVLSVYVVLKRMAFIGQGISHSAFGGIALGVLLFAASPHAQTLIYVTGILFAVSIAFAIAAITRRHAVSEDSAIGVFFVVSMAFGVICFSKVPGFSQDAFGYLFGNILAVSAEELVGIFVMSVAVLGLVALLHKEFFYYVFDEEMARVSGLPVAALHYLLLALLSVVIVLSVKMIGIILVSAFLVLPGVTAHLLSRRMGAMMAGAVAFGVATTVSGVVLSAYLDWPTGASIVVLQFAAFLLVLGLSRLSPSAAASA